MTDSQSFPKDVLLQLNRLATTAKLLSGAAHEVNNALMIISGTVEMIEQPALPPHVTQGLERVQKQTARAARALTDALLFARAPAPDTASVNVREIVSHSVSLRKFASSRGGITVTMTGDETARWTVTGHRTQLQQAVLNLLINAEQAVGNPGGTIQVEMTADDARIGVRVIDNGRGIDPARRDRVFDPFVSSKAATEGAGLGLWAARVIVEAHGGSIVIEDRSPGAAVVIWLPRAS